MPSRFARVAVKPEKPFVVVIPGAHLVRDPVMPKASTDQELRDMGWFEGKAHPVTGAALEMVALDLPPGTAHKPGAGEFVS